MTVLTKGVVLVTGASGFIGRRLVDHLAIEGWYVVAASRSPAGVPVGPHVTYRALPDLSQPVDWRPLLTDVTDVVHLAALAHATDARKDSDYAAINTDAAISLAQAARDAGVRRMVYISSVRAQCAPSLTRLVRESDVPEPTDAYGRSKLAAERGIAEALTGTATTYTHLRPVLTYGPGVKGNMRALVRLAAVPVPLPIRNLTGLRSLLSVANLVTVIAHALVEPRCVNRTFLVTDGDPLTVPEIVGALRAGMGWPPGLIPVPASIAARVARLAGAAEAWERLSGDLVASSDEIRATGWHPVEDSRVALAAMAAAETRPTTAQR